MEKKGKIKKAVALRYKSDKDFAPKVVAKGSREVALKIIEIAKQNGIPIKNDPDLVEVLSKLDINELIPANVYVVVAEILAFVYSMNGKKSLYNKK
jgi:flagellar biosynthesis protein